MTVHVRGNPARWWKTRSCGAGSRAPTAMFVSPARRYAGAGALGFLLVLLGGLGYATNPTRVARLSEVLLSRVLGGNVTVRSARLSLSGTLLLNGVEVRTSDPEPMPGSDIPILSAEMIQARFDWMSLVMGNLSATQLVAESAVFRPIENRETGHWNYERLKPSRSESEPSKRVGSGPSRPMSLPVVVVHNGRVQWGEARGGVVQKTGETIIDGRLTPDAGEPTLYRFQFMQSAPAEGVKPGETRPADVGVMLTGAWDLAKNVFSASTGNVVLTDAVRRGMPRAAREWCDRHQLAGRLGELNVSFNERDGLTMKVTFDSVSMMWMVEPQPGIGVGEERPSYPLTVNDVRGEVVFSMKKETVEIRELRGEILGYGFVADCTLMGMSPEAAFALNLRFPNAVIGERYPALFMATLPSQDLIQRVRPHGKADLSVQISRPAPKAELLVKGTIDCQDAQIRFAHFPFPLEHLKGRITFDEQSVTFHDVTAVSEDNRVRIQGTTGTKWTNTLIDFMITSDQVTFDDRLGACLPKQFEPIWDQFAIQARGGFACHVTRKRDVSGPPQVTVDVMLESGEGYMKWMPYRFRNAKGRLHFGDGQARIEGFTAETGPDGTGRVTIDGVVKFPTGDVTQLSPDLRITADVPIEPQLLMALPDEVGDPLEKVQLAGRVGFQGTVRLEEAAPGVAGTQSAPVVSGVMQWKGGALATSVGEWPVAFREIEAEAQISKATMELRKFEGQWQSPWGKAEQVRLQASGQVDLEKPSAVLKVQLDGKQLTVPGALPVFLPAEWREGWTAYAPAGRVDVRGTGTARINTGERTATLPGLAMEGLDLAVTAQGASVKRKEWPEGIENLHGTVRLTPGVVEMKEMSATVGVMGLQWGGQANLETGRLALNGTVESKGLPVKWLGYLPPDVGRSLDTSKREGAETALTLQVKELVREKGDSPWTFHATLNAGQLGFTAPLAMQVGKATLVSTGTFAPASGDVPAALDADGVLAGTQLLVLDRLLDTVTARIDVVAADRSIHISDIDGKVGDGTLKGRVHVYTEPPAPGGKGTAATTSVPGTMARGIATNGGYHAELSLKDAELARVFMPPGSSEEEKKKLGTGKVAATLTLDETFGTNVNRDGHGEMAITDAVIYKVPLSMGLMQVVTLRLPVASSFHAAAMTYTVENDSVRFDKILLESRGINLAGTGTVGIKSKSLDLSFVTETPNEQFIPILSPIIRETRNELMQLSVGGTLDNPRVVPVPLSGIANTLRSLLPSRRGMNAVGLEGGSTSRP